MKFQLVLKRSTNWFFLSPSKDNDLEIASSLSCLTDSKFNKNREVLGNGGGAGSKAKPTERIAHKDLETPTFDFIM